MSSVRALKDTRKPIHIKEHVKNDSIRYFIKNFENYELKPKFKL